MPKMQKVYKVFADLTSTEVVGSIILGQKLIKMLDVQHNDMPLNIIRGRIVNIFLSVKILKEA